MKGFFASARSRLAEASNRTVTSKTYTATTSKMTSDTNKQNHVKLVLTKEQRESNIELSNCIDQLMIIGDVVSKFILDMEKFLDVVQQLCVQHVMMADGFRVIFAKSKDDAEATFAYSSACSKLANRVRGHTEHRLQQSVLHQLSKKNVVINDLKHRVFKWQDAHNFFLATLNSARKRHFKSGKTSNDELHPNDISQIRLAESSCDTIARILVLEIGELHQSRFEWIRQITQSFKEIQAEFYTMAGATLTEGVVEIQSKSSSVKGSMLKSPFSQSSASEMLNNNSDGTLMINSKELMVSPLVGKSSLIRRHIFNYLTAKDTSRCGQVWRAPGVVWSWFVQDSPSILPCKCVMSIVKSSFIQNRLREECFVTRSVPRQGVISSWVALGLIPEDSSNGEKSPLENAPFASCSNSSNTIVCPEECAEWYSKILAQANTYEISKIEEKKVKNENDKNDPILQAFLSIEEDIERTMSRKVNGPSKRGGKLKGFTVNYNGDDSKESLESLVASALGQTGRESVASIESIADNSINDIVMSGEDIKALGKKNMQHENSIRNVLRAFSFSDTKIRYCQGINFLVQSILDRYCCSGKENNIIDGVNEIREDIESAAFGILMSLMNTYGLRDLYVSGFRGLKRCFYQLDDLTKEYFPVLMQHFQECNIKTSMYATSWFLTLFNNFDCLGPMYAERVLDVFLVEGWIFIFQVSLAIIHSLESKLLGSNFEAILRILQNPAEMIVSMYNTPKKFIDAAARGGINKQFVVTRQMLKESEERYIDSL